MPDLDIFIETVEIEWRETIGAARRSLHHDQSVTYKGLQELYKIGTYVTSASGALAGTKGRKGRAIVYFCFLVFF